ncbi:MAG: hypothetical protein Q4F15_02725 [Bacillota bacterium]|nr:hypothetical protein [Bacillota bacterium]
MSLAERYLNWSPTKKNVFYLSCLAIVVTLALTPFAFFSNPGVPFGFLVGSATSILAYLSIVWGANLLTYGGESTQKAAAGLSALFNIARMAVYCGVLAIAACCTFMWENNWLNFWSVFAAFFPMPIVLAITTTLDKKKAEPVSLSGDPSMHKSESEDSEVTEADVEENDELERLKAEKEKLERQIASLESEKKDGGKDNG